MIAWLLIVIPPSLYAQDLPLKDILLDGQGWTSKPITEVTTTSGKPVMKMAHTVYGWDEPRERVAMIRTPDLGTLLAVNPIDAWVYAVPCDQGTPVKNGTRYAPLKFPRGETKSGAVSITVDTVGRMYVSTTVGIQVFDPTGRLCGVLANPANSPLENLHWNGDTLIGHVQQTEFRRTLNATGIKSVLP